MSEPMLDAAGRRRSPATLPEFHAGRPPRNKGMRYPADPPTIEEIVTVMRRAGDGVHGRRLRGLIVVLGRAGLRICEALALAEADLDARRGSLLVRRGRSSEAPPRRPPPLNGLAVPGRRPRSAGRGQADDAARGPRRRAARHPNQPDTSWCSGAHAAAPATRSRPASG
jgi:integrase